MLRWLLASLHLLALPLGLGAVWARARALSRARAQLDLPAIFNADSVWGLAALLWITTGLFRALAGLEKPSSYYFHDRMFYLKMGLLLVILLLEIWPMSALIRWRVNVRRGLVLSILWPALNTIGGVMSALMVYFGGLSAAQGMVTAGAWYLFLLSLVRFLYPVMSLSSFWTSVQIQDIQLAYLTARYVKYRFVGGASGSAVTGTVYFDAVGVPIRRTVSYIEPPPFSFGNTADKSRIVRIGHCACASTRSVWDTCSGPLDPCVPMIIKSAGNSRARCRMASSKWPKVIFPSN